MRTLLIDNHDSYTYNVFHLLAGVSGEEPIVVDNDAVSWRALERWDFDAIVLSPGPGTPGRWHDFCVCDDILRYSEIPVLGICLGHQGLGKMLDGDVRSAPEAMHGRLSQIFHEGDGLFEGIPQGFPVVRYHSLAITGMGPEGNVCAWANDGVVMGIEHRNRPLWGVQFHPESIATEHGAKLVENFYKLARQRKEPPVRATKRPQQRPAAQSGGQGRRRQGRAADAHDPRRGPDRGALRTALRRRGARLLARQRRRADAAGAELLPRHQRRARPLRARVRRRGRRGQRPRQRGHRRSSAARSSTCSTARWRSARSSARPSPAPDLLGGFVGYLGYECKADCGASNEHSSDVPDAVLMLANRLIAVDHVRHRTHLLAIRCGEDAGAEQLARRGRGGRARPPRRAARGRHPRRARLRRAERGARALPVRPRARAIPRRHRPHARPNSPPASPTRSASPIRSRPTPAPTPSTSTATCAAAIRRPSPPT